jgi:hypothetical protein
MKKILFVTVPLLFIIFSGFLISCDFLLPAPMGRNNPLDDGAQIAGFNAEISGSDTILTSWDWRSSTAGIDASRIIDKIRVVYSENNVPTSKYPLNPDNVQVFDSSSSSKCEWYNLNRDNDHYFALYAHETGGLWLSPEITSERIESNGSVETSNAGYSALYVNTSVPTNTLGTTSLPITGLPPTNIGFFSVDLLNNSNYGAVLGAGITNWTGTFGDIYILPVRKKAENGMFWGDISDGVYYDYDNALYATITGPNDVIDIKNQLNLAQMYGSNTIAFVPADAVVSIVIGGLQFFDGTNDLFSIWKKY